MAGIALEKVSRIYAGGVVAVDAIDLEVHDKEFLVLVGPSGCGKTTTLRMIAGLEDITSGEIRIGGRRVNDLLPKDRDIAMVFQNYALYPHMSVYRNMTFGSELRYGTGWLSRAFWRVVNPRRASELRDRRKQTAADVRWASQILGIEHLLERLPRQLSGGERQRVALGRAIVRQPAAFLFDEPLSNLDARLRVEMRRELKDLHRRLAATMVYVTHDQVEALTLGQRIVVMHQGVVQQIGAPMQVYDQPRNRFVAGFIGTPPMNFVDGALKESNGELELRAGDYCVPLGGQLGGRIRQSGLQACALGIRPEDVRVAAAATPPQTAGSGSPASEGDLAESVQLAGRIEVVELLGDSTLVTVKCGHPDESGRGPIEEQKLEGVGKAETATRERSPRTQEGICLVSKLDSRSSLQVGQPVLAYFRQQRAACV